MSGRGFITISMHELERVEIIEAVVQRRLTIVETGLKPGRAGCFLVNSETLSDANCCSPPQVRLDR